jgi:nicotinamidase-related amidase
MVVMSRAVACFTRFVVLTGMAANICVLFTANDAYVRDFHLVVPTECVTSNSEEENHFALQKMQAVLKADIRCSTVMTLGTLG